MTCSFTLWPFTSPWRTFYPPCHWAHASITSVPAYLLMVICSTCDTCFHWWISATQCAVFSTDMVPIQRCSELRKWTGNNSHELLHISTSMTVFCAKSRCSEMKAERWIWIYLSNFIFSAYFTNVLFFRRHVEHVNRSSISCITSTGVQKLFLTVQTSTGPNGSSRFDHACTRVTISWSLAVISTRVIILSKWAHAFTRVNHLSKIDIRSSRVNKSSTLAQRSTFLHMLCDFAWLFTPVYYLCTFRLLDPRLRRPSILWAISADISCQRHLHRFIQSYL